MSDKLKRYAALFAGLLVLATAWQVFRDKPAPVGEYTAAPVSPATKNTPKQDIHPGKVEVLVPKAKKDLGLSEAEQNDPTLYVLGAAKLPSDTHPQTVVAVIDEDTGQTRLAFRRDPLPWLKPEQTGEVRIDYGLKNGMTKVARLTVREDLLQVKALHAGIHATLDTDGQYFVGGGVGWRW